MNHISVLMNYMHTACQIKKNNVHFSHVCIKISKEKRVGILFCKSSHINENSSSYFILLLKARGKTCAIEIHQGRLCK